MRRRHRCSPVWENKTDANRPRQRRKTPTGGNQETKNHDDDDQLVTTIDASKILVGGDGGDFIAHTLSNANDVNAAIGRVQKLGAFRCNDDTAECVLGLLSALGVRRGEGVRGNVEKSGG